MDFKNFIRHSGEAFKSLINNRSNNPFKQRDGEAFYSRDLIAKWLNKGDKYLWYCENPVLSSTINAIAGYCAKARFTVTKEDSSGKLTIVKNDPLVKRIKKPNFWQGQEEFIKQYTVNTLLFGGSFNLVVNPGPGFENRADKAQALINLSMNNAEFEDRFTGNIVSDYDQAEEAFFNKTVHFNIAGASVSVSMKELISFYDLGNTPNNEELSKPVSRVEPLLWDLSNIMVALEAKNVMAGKPGGVGIIGVGSKDSTQNVPLSGTERQELEDQYKNAYGLSHSKSAVIFTSATMSYSPTMPKYSDLGLDSIQNDSTLSVLRAFAFPKEIYSMDAAKYENKLVAELQVIEGIVKTTMDTYARNTGNFFKYPEEGKLLTASFDHLYAFTVKTLNQAQRLETITNAVGQGMELGLIDETRAKEIIENVTNFNYD